MNAAQLKKKLKKLQETVTTSIEIVTPEMAAEFKAKFRCNRRVRKSKVRLMAGDISSNKWRFTGQANIIIDDKGITINGEHTCDAIILSGSPAICTIVRGVPSLSNVAALSIDSGTVKTNADCLGMVGEKDPNNLAAIINLCTIYKQAEKVRSKDRPAPHLGRANVITSEGALDAVRKYSYYREATSFSRKYSVEVIMARMSVVGAVKFLSHEIDPKVSDEFFEILIGEKVSKIKNGCPILALRRALARDLKKRQICSSHGMDRRTMMAIFLKAFNAYRKGERVKSLSYTRGESFPFLKK